MNLNNTAASSELPMWKGDQFILDFLSATQFQFLQINNAGQLKAKIFLGEIPNLSS